MWAYRVMRMAAAVYGVLVTASSVGALLAPDEGPQQRLLDAALILYGLLLIAPHRWTIRDPWYRVKLYALMLGALWSVWASLSALSAFASGDRPWPIIPIALLFVTVGLAAPLTLILHRRRGILAK
jgi:hypothetical protein